MYLENEIKLNSKFVKQLHIFKSIVYTNYYILIVSHKEIYCVESIIPFCRRVESMFIMRILPRRHLAPQQQQRPTPQKFQSKARLLPSHPS